MDTEAAPVLSLYNVCRGAADEIFQREVNLVIDNIIDVNVLALVRPRSNTFHLVNESNKKALNFQRIKPIAPSPAARPTPARFAFSATGDGGGEGRVSTTLPSSVIFAWIVSY